MIARHYKDLKKIVLLLMILALAYNIYFSDYIQKKYYYPLVYEKTIQEVSKQYKLDPFFILALIKNESKFNPQAESPNGALGLMQIMPETGVWIAEQTKWKNFTLTSLRDPVLNIKFGSWYIAELEHEFDGNEVLMLAAYNAGRGNVNGWIEKYHWNKNFSDINAIPFVETQIYIRRILHDKQIFSKYYHDNI